MDRGGPTDVLQSTTGKKRIVDEPLLTELLVKEGPCIADSVIRLPRRLRDEGFEAIECNIGYAYGEGPWNEGIRGTPYLQHTPLGGGLCAQATCFIASVICHRNIQTIFTIPEITAVVFGAQRSFELKGMKLDEIRQFFHDRRVGLRAIPQYEFGREPIRKKLVTAAFRSYVGSSVPVVLSVDMKQMLSSIVPGNNVPMSAKVVGDDLVDYYHCVALVGYSTSEEAFLINDPATYPFLKASIDEIYNVRCRFHRNTESEPLVQFIAVVPKSVRMPLLRGRTEYRTYLPGLLDQMLALQTSDRHPEIWTHLLDAGLRFGDYANYDPGTIRLVDLGGSDGELREDLKWLAENQIEFLLRAIREGHIDKSWHWIQYWRQPREGVTSESIWVWDAQQEPVEKYVTPQRYLRGVAYLVTDTGKWLWAYCPTGPAVANTAHETGLPKPLPPDQDLPEQPVKASVLSSYCTLGASMPDSLAWIDPYHSDTYGVEEERSKIANIPCEVYLLMEPETVYWSRKFGLENPETAVEFLASLSDQHAESLVEQVARNFRQMGSEIVAIASFVPEIARPSTSDDGRRGVQAVRRLIAIALRLQEAWGHPTHTIELVSGSRIQGIWANLPSKRANNVRPNVFNMVFSVDVLDEGTARTRLLDNLKAAVKGLEEQHKIYLALELEPGQYFNLRDWDSAVLIGEALQRDSQLRSRVGFNLDIGHWCVADIERDFLEYNKWEPNHPVRSRILHAHASAIHHCSHFGDIPLADVPPREEHELREWLKLIRQIAARRGTSEGDPPFSGHVSLELEAALNEQQVTESYRLLDGWL